MTVNAVRLWAVLAGLVEFAWLTAIVYYGVKLALWAGL